MHYRNSAYPGDYRVLLAGEDPVLNLCARSAEVGVPDLCEGNAGILRCDMPQMPTSKELLEGTAPFSKWLAERQIGVVATVVDSDILKATQMQLDFEKVMRMVKGALAGEWEPWAAGDNMVQFTEDGYILDGHHRWCATRVVEAKTGKKYPLHAMLYNDLTGKRRTTVANLLAIANRSGTVGHSKCGVYEHTIYRADASSAAVAAMAGAAGNYACSADQNLCGMNLFTQCALPDANKQNPYDAGICVEVSIDPQGNPYCCSCQTYCGLPAYRYKSPTKYCADAPEGMPCSLGGGPGSATDIRDGTCQFDHGKKTAYCVPNCWNCPESD